MKNVYLLFVALACCISGTAIAQNQITTAQAGNWSETSTWEGGVLPTAENKVKIVHNVTVDVDSVKVAALEISKTLSFSTTDTSVVVVYGELKVTSTGTLDNNVLVTTGVGYCTPIIVHGNFINNGTVKVAYPASNTDDPYGGFTMGASTEQTSISGSGSFGNFRTLCIDNPQGVKMETTSTFKLTSRLFLNDGVFYPNDKVSFDYANTGSGSNPSVSNNFRIIRSQSGTIVDPPAYPTAFYLTYLHNPNREEAQITEGVEMPSSRSINGFAIDNPMGVHFMDDLTIKGNAGILVMKRGALSMPEGKMITSTNANSIGASPSTSTSYIDAPLAFTLTASAKTITLPIGKDGTSRTVKLSDISSSGGNAVIRVEIEKAEAGTGSLGEELSPYRRKISMLSGTLNNYSAINLEKGLDEDSYQNSPVLTSPNLDGLYSPLQGEGSYTDVGYFSLHKEYSSGMSSQDRNRGGEDLFSVTGSEKGISCEIYSNTNETIAVYVCDVYGKKIASGVVDASKGKSSCFFPFEVQSKTLYLVTAVGKEMLISKKFIY